jgi:hypothetical protein
MQSTSNWLFREDQWQYYSTTALLPLHVIIIIYLVVAVIIVVAARDGDQGRKISESTFSSSSGSID